MNDTIHRWENTNSLVPDKPVVWLNEICWHEMNVNDELTVLCESEIGRRIETDLRKIIYQWNHMAADMVVDPVFYSPVIMENSGFGIHEHADIRVTDPNNTIASRHFDNLIKTEDDIELIKPPKITYDAERTKKFHEFYGDIFKGILPVEIRGNTGFWFAPWDDITMWKGAEPVLTDLAVEPDLMHKLINRLVDCYMTALDQFAELNLLARNDCNVRIGSGGYGYVRDLPQKDFESQKVRTIDMWGSATPQIFAAVSPEMHEEFGVKYERKWLERFGLSYYGCCEPLHGKIDILSKIPNLRKISMSPWAKLDNVAERVKGKYVISYKPSSAYFAYDPFNPEQVKARLKKDLLLLKGCCIEIILKDISTVRYEPQRLWEWVKITNEVINELYA
jgi:hypothetical protein